MIQQIILLIEKLNGIPCPNKECFGKLKYLAYTAFSCQTCKEGYTIKIMPHSEYKRYVGLSEDKWI